MTTTTRQSALGLLHVPPGDGETINVLGDTATFKVTSDISGDLIIVELTTPPGGGPPRLHAHPPHEAFYVLDGEFEWRGHGPDGPFTIRATPGSVVYVPPGAAHTFTNVGPTTGRMLGIYTSPRMEHFPRALAIAATETDPPTPAALQAVFTDFEITFLDELDAPLASSASHEMSTGGDRNVLTSSVSHLEPRSRD